MHGAIAEDRHPKDESLNLHNIPFYFVFFVFFVDQLRFPGLTILN